MTEVRALVFDVFGTLVDWRSSVVASAIEVGRRAGVSADWTAVTDDWRRAYPPALERARTEPSWRDLDALQRETLDDVLTRHGVVLPAVQQADAEVAERPRRQFLVRRRRRAHGQRLALLDQRTNHVRLAALRQGGAQFRVDPLPVALAQPARRHRLAARRQLADQ